MSVAFVIGVRITKGAGLSFFGIEEVNEALKEGGRVVALEHGDALFQKIDEDEATARLALSGFTIKVSIEK